MKRIPSPLILFIGVFLTALLLQEYTFIYQELDGLFLWSGDYFTSMLRTPFPLSGIIGDFLTQFFRYRYIAPMISALEVVLAYFLVRGILSRFRLGWDVLAVFLACIMWVTQAFAPSAKTGVAILLILIPVYLVSLFFPKRQPYPLNNWIQWIGSAALVAGVALFLSFNSRIERREKASALRVAVVYSNWNKVLSITTTQATAEDRNMLPFAMMALGMKGQLGDRIFEYDVRSEDDLCFNEDSYVGLFFRGFLYNNLLCPNEAVHNFFQLSTLQAHGQSFMVLRQLVANHYVMGNFTLARKYLAILSRSSCHSRFVHYYNTLMKDSPTREADGIDFRKNVTLLSHDQFTNLLALDAAGLKTPFLRDRILCSLLVRGDLKSFQTYFQTVADAYPVLPKYYMLALNMPAQ